MNLWCPQCNNTSFVYEKTNSENSPEGMIIHDHMRCKNRNCNYEFNIQWYDSIRSAWINATTERFRTRRTSK